ncbi:MAG: biotin transporter BioY [Planctomycetota bacterium]|nr:biotin transporter BioY [Planctomycetota bacterium]
MREIAISSKPISSRYQTLADEIILVLLGAAAVAVSAQAKLSLWPVPITLQTFAVLLVGALLGSTRGAASILTYLLAGSAAPVLFANPTGLAGPTGGYLIGFVISAWLTGMLFERGWGQKATSMVASLLIGTSVVYAVGVPWLMMFVSSSAVLKVGLLPFLPGAALKIALAGLVLTRVNR